MVKEKVVGSLSLNEETLGKVNFVLLIFLYMFSLWLAANRGMFLILEELLGLTEKRCFLGR
jgi:hypothetical protein